MSQSEFFTTVIFVGMGLLFFLILVFVVRWAFRINTIVSLLDRQLMATNGVNANLLRLNKYMEFLSGNVFDMKSEVDIRGAENNYDEREFMYPCINCNTPTLGNEIIYGVCRKCHNQEAKSVSLNCRQCGADLEGDDQAYGICGSCWIKD